MKDVPSSSNSGRTEAPPTLDVTKNNAKEGPRKKTDISAKRTEKVLGKGLLQALAEERSDKEQQEAQERQGENSRKTELDRTLGDRLLQALAEERSDKEQQEAQERQGENSRRTASDRRLGRGLLQALAEDGDRRRANADLPTYVTAARGRSFDPSEPVPAYPGNDTGENTERE